MRIASAGISRSVIAGSMAAVLALSLAPATALAAPSERPCIDEGIAALAAGTAAEVVSVALGEPDGVPEGGYYNKYNGYSGLDWCGHFVVWCARQAGVSEDVVPELYNAQSLRDWYETRGLYRDWSYTPKPGDLIFYSYSGNGVATHVGFVADVVDGRVITREGNVTNGQVLSFRRAVGSNASSVIGYATPLYAGESPDPDPAPDPDSPASFSDVDFSSWYGAGVNFVVEEGLMKGYSDGTFGVGRTMTRAELAVTLWRWAAPDEADSYDEAAAVDETGIAGVADGTWYTGAANWAVKNGVIGGVTRPDGSRDFDPDGNVTFEQLIVVLANLTADEGEVEATGTRALDAFADADEVSDWAAKPMAWAYKDDLFDGYSGEDGTRWAKPQERVARERVAAVLENALA